MPGYSIVGLEGVVKAQMTRWMISIVIIRSLGIAGWVCNGENIGSEPGHSGAPL